MSGLKTEVINRFRWILRHFKEVSMQGFIYRLAIRIKDAGERRHWAWLARLGISLKERVLQWKN